MAFRWMCAIALLAAVTAHAEPKTITVPGDFPAVKAAVEAAAPGDTVLIKPGQYQESLVIDKPVTLRGEAPEQVLLRNTVLAGNVIKITSKEAVLLENLIVEHSDREPDGQEPKYPDLVLVEGGKAELRRCVLRKGGGSGLSAGTGSEVTAKDCRMEDNVRAGAAIHDKGTVARLSGNTLAKNGNEGIVVYDEGAGVFTENSVLKNRRNGILAVGPAPEGIVIQGNRAEANAETGIHVDRCPGVAVLSNICIKNLKEGIRAHTGTPVEVRQNLCEGNEGAGIHAGGAGTVAAVEENRCMENQGAGIAVLAGARAAIKGNTATGNGGNGVAVRNWETSADITGNTCTGNTLNGILVSHGAAATVEGNTCTANKGRGVAQTDEGTAATVGANTLEGNADNAPIKSLPPSRQAQADRFYAGWALAAEQYDYLESLARRLRENKCRDAQGVWELKEFYEGLCEGYWIQTWRNKEPFTATVTKWCEQKPQSVTARIALAKTHMEHAWEARGNGYGKDVTPEGRKGFKDFQTEAEKVLKEAESLAEKDPMLYETWLYAGIGRGYKRDQQEAVFARGVALAPDFYPMHYMMGFYYTPRWHGEDNDLEEFLQRAWDVSKAACGDTLYANLAADYSGEFTCTYAGSGEMAQWSGVDSGFRQLLVDFPDSTRFLNLYCFMACLFREKGRAAELFAKIGGQQDHSVWGSEEESEFNRYQRWATMDDYPFPCENRRTALPFNVTPNAAKRYLLVGSAVLVGISLLATLLIVLFFGGRALRQPRR